MSQKVYPGASVFSMVAFVVVLAVLGWSFWERWTWISGIVGTQGLVEEKGPGFGSTDWVVWQDQDAGVVAVKVHPLAKNHPVNGSSPIREGDILRRIDQTDIYQAEVVQAIARHAQPGMVLMYQVERSSKLGPERQSENLLVQMSFEPRFTFRQYTGLWVLSPWVLMLGSFLSLVTLLIIFPIVRPTLRENWPVILVTGFCLLLFLLLGLRHLNLVVRTEFVKIRFEQWFTWMVVCALPLYGSASLLACLLGRGASPKASKWLPWLVGVPVLGTVGLGMLTYEAVFGDNFLYYAHVLEAATWLLFLAQVFALLLYSTLVFWRGRSGIDKVFHLLSMLYTLSLASFQGWSMWAGTDEGWYEPVCFLSMGAIVIPLISMAASQLKFGRVSLVLTSSLQYVLFGAITLILFLAIERALAGFGFRFQYQIYLELSLLIVLIIILRAVWKGYEERFRRYFILAQQERRDKIAWFTASIPQYTSSQKLLEDLGAALKAYFETSFVAVRLKEEPETGNRLEIFPADEEAIFAYLSGRSSYWARTRQVSIDPLPAELEAVLGASPASVALPVAVNERIYGMLYLGKKRRGVYNLDDMEVLGRIIQQTRLTLGVLHLLEREKLLLEKNFEANLTALRSQINPHFLFNTLNTISALIHDDPDGAEKAVEKLAFIFRYTLKNSDKAMVTLRDELSLVKTYLEIEQIRFGDRLNLSFQLDPAGMDVELPAFVVQTVIENCIKHGIARITGRGMVSISMVVEEDAVRCEIYDNGPGIDLSRVQASTGLSNILTRMHRIYGREDLLKFENTGNGTRVTIWVPMKQTA